MVLAVYNGIRFRTDPISLLFSLKDVLVSFGNNEEELHESKNEVLDFQLQLKDNSILKKNLADIVNSGIRIPKNQERRIYAFCCGFFATNYIFFHEIAHMLSGHLGYIKSIHGQSYISEFGNEIDLKFENELFQVLEYQADKVASAILYSSMEKGGAFAAMKKLFKNDGNELDYEEAVRILLLSIGLLNRMCASAAGEHSIFNSRHPHPDIRLILNYRRFRSFANAEGTEKSEKCRNATNWALETLDETWEKLRLPKSFKKMVGTHEDDVEKQVKTLEERDEELRKKLKKYRPTNLRKKKGGQAFAFLLLLLC